MQSRISVPLEPLVKQNTPQENMLWGWPGMLQFEICYPDNSQTHYNHFSSPQTRMTTRDKGQYFVVRFAKRLD